MAQNLLFNNRAFPIVQTQNEIIPALKRDFVRTVIWRDPLMKERDQQLKEAFSFPDNRHANSLFSPPMPGYRSFTEQLTPEIIKQEAEFSKIIIDPSALDNLTNRINGLYNTFPRIFGPYTNHRIYPDDKMFLLFANRHGVEGRAPVWHIDYMSLFCHFSIAGAPLEIYNGTIDKKLWKLIKTISTGSGDSEWQEAVLESNKIMNAHAEPVELGDIVFMKGFEKDYPRVHKDYRYMRETNSGIHRSNLKIPELGQASILIG